jgi:aryl-alcohol dehydrogenase-like predicted oxidoreductase
MSIEFDGHPLFAEVQATWNLLSQEVGATLDLARRAGMGVIIKEAVANGRLTSRNQNSAFFSKRAVLENAAESVGTTIDAIAIAAVLAQPWVDVVLSGAANVEHLKSNAEALNCDLGSLLDQLMDSLREDADTYWETRSDLSWN